MTDGELVRRVVAGDTAAYGELARRWFYRILAFCQARLIEGRVHDAEDLAQDVLVRGYANLGSLDNPEHFGPWLRGIASHVCADWGRDRRCLEQAFKGLDCPSESSSAIPVESAEKNDERAVVMMHVGAMPEALREVILLHYYEDLTYDEMARWLGVARATVNERLSKARALLRIRLAKLRSDA